MIYNLKVMAQEQELLLAEEHLRVVLDSIAKQRTTPSVDMTAWLRQVNMHLNMATQLINSVVDEPILPKAVQKVQVKSSLLQENEPIIESLDIQPPEPTPVVVHSAHDHEKVAEVKEIEKKNTASVSAPIRKNTPPPTVATSTPQVQKKRTAQYSGAKQTIADAYMAKAPTSTNDSTRVDAVLGERMQPLKSIQKGLTVNDRLRFASALFDGNRELFADLVRKLDLAETLPVALAILHENYKGEADAPELQEFILLLERRFVS